MLGDDRRCVSPSDLGPILEAAIAQCPSAVFVCDLEARFIHVNDAACTLTGHSRDELSTMRVFDIVAPRAIDRVQAHIGSILTGGRAAGDYEMIRADGAIRWCRVDASCADGVNLVAFVTDITDHVEAHEEIARRESQLRAIFDSAQDMIFLKNLELRYTHINRAALEYLGKTADEVVGRTDREIFEDDRAAEIAAVDRRVLAGAEEKTLTTRGPRGEECVLETIKVPLHDDDGNVVGLCGVCRDLTELRQMEEQLRQAQKLEAVGRLAAGVAHDFNNLLTPILGYTDLLRDALAEDAAAVRDLAAIERAGSRARDLTASLLAFSRKQVLDRRPLDLNEVLHQTRPMLERLVRENVDFRLELQDDPAWVHADRGQLQNVLINLVANAADAMPDGGDLTIATGAVELDPDTGGPSITLTVTDTGRGMTPETRRRAFEPFYTTKEVDEGAGLGLATVHGIVSQHGGHVEVASEPGRGCTLTVSLPRLAAEPSPDAVRPESERLRGTESVLLVEDADSVRELTAEVLRKYGYRVTAVSAPEQALALQADDPMGFVLLLADVVLPGMNGARLHRELAARWPGLQVLFMSGYTHDVVSYHGVEADGQSFLQKPFQPVDLLLKVRQLLDGDAG